MILLLAHWRTIRTDDVIGDDSQPENKRLLSMVSPLCEFDKGFNRRNKLGVLVSKWQVRCWP